MTKVKAITLFSIAFILLSLTVLSDTAFAEISTSNVLDNVIERFQSQAKTWVTEIKIHARYLFICLATISMVWTMGQLLYHRSSFPELFGEFIRFLCFTGLFLWFLENAPKMSEDIILGFRKMGALASGSSALTPSGIVDVGFQIFSVTWMNVSFMDGATGIGSVLCSLIILIVLALVAINMLLQICATWLLAYAGVFFLGFGGCRWTSDMAVNYLKTVLSLGASLMTMLLLVGLGESILFEYFNNMASIKYSGDSLFKELSIMLVVSLTLFMLVEKLPPMVGGIVTGASIGMSTGVGAFGAGTALGAAMTAGAASLGVIKSPLTLPGSIQATGSSLKNAAGFYADAGRAVGRGATWLAGKAGISSGTNNSGGNSPFPTPSSGTPLDQ